MLTHVLQNIRRVKVKSNTHPKLLLKKLSDLRMRLKRLAHKNLKRQLNPVVTSNDKNLNGYVAPKTKAEEL